MGKRIEHVALFVVFDVDHIYSLQHIDIERNVYHKNELSASQI